MVYRASEDLVEFNSTLAGDIFDIVLQLRLGVNYRDLLVYNG